jgi:membrane glycosyltransferase
MERLTAILNKALEDGPDSLNNDEKKLILSDPDTLKTLHEKVWRLSGEKAVLWKL